MYFDYLRIIWKFFCRHSFDIRITEDSRCLIRIPRELWRDPKWFKTLIMHFPSQLHSLIFTGFVRASVALQTNRPNSFHSFRSNVDYSHRLAARRQIRNPVVNFTCQETPARNWSLHRRDEFSSRPWIQFIPTQPFKSSLSLYNDGHIFKD